MRRPLPIDRRIGIEIEAESRGLTYRDVSRELTAIHEARNREGDTRVPRAWEVLQDGSLRGGVCSWEIRTYGNAGQSTGNVYSWLDDLIMPMSDSIGTWRAAVHCHVDVRDFGTTNLGKLMAVLYCVDSGIFERHAPHRVESNFCVPLFNITPACTEYISRIYRHGLTTDWNKYTSCNFNAINNFGSIEFRHMETPAASSLDEANAAIDKIWRFASDCVRIVDFVHRGRDRTLPELLQGLDSLGYEVDPEKKFVVLSAATQAMERRSSIAVPADVANVLGYSEVVREPELEQWHDPMPNDDHMDALQAGLSPDQLLRDEVDADFQEAFQAGLSPDQAVRFTAIVQEILESRVDEGEGE
jgi:hypothetical protein